MHRFASLCALISLLILSFLAPAEALPTSMCSQGAVQADMCHQPGAPLPAQPDTTHSHACSFCVTPVATLPIRPAGVTAQVAFAATDAREAGRTVLPDRPPPRA